MLALVRDVVAQGETSVVFSSHILHDVEAVCTDVVMIKKGRLVVSGKIDALKRMDETVFEVRVKGETQRFLALLAAQGARCESGRRDLLKIIPPEGRGADAIFRAAQQTGVQVRHLMHQRDSLEDVFIEAVDEESQGERRKAKGENLDTDSDHIELAGGNAQ